MTAPHQIEMVRDCLQRGDFYQASMVAQHLRRHGVRDAQLAVYLAMIAWRIGEPDAALAFFDEAEMLAPGSAMLRRHREQAMANLDSLRRELAAVRTRAAPGFLLIKAWGFGIWSDMDHVLGQLLVCELTGRIPVVHWGRNSRYRRNGGGDAFSLYFEPLSPYTLDDLRRHGGDFFPPKWTAANLEDEDLNKWAGPWSRMAGIFFLHRPEEVVVSDFHTYLDAIVPWAPAGSPWAERATQDVYGELVRKYLRLRPELSEDIERFWTQEMVARRPLIAVHVRGAEKGRESTELAAMQARYRERLDLWLAEWPEATIFLLTDSEALLDEYRRRYGPRVIATPCRRSTGGEGGVHNVATADGYALGVEIVRDTWLATRCDRFLGSGESNVGCMVRHLWRGRPEDCVLLGEHLLTRLNWYG